MQVPPESQRNRVASAGFEGAVAKHFCEWHPWNQEGERCSELDARIELNRFANEIKLLSHARVDLVAVLGSVLHLRSLLHSEADVLCYFRGLALELLCRDLAQ